MQVATNSMEISVLGSYFVSVGRKPSDIRIKRFRGKPINGRCVVKKKGYQSRKNKWNYKTTACSMLQIVLNTFLWNVAIGVYLNVLYKFLQAWMKLVNILKLLDVFTRKIYFQLLHKAIFYAPTCFGYLFWPSSGSYNSIKTQAGYRISINGKHIHIVFFKVVPCILIFSKSFI